MYSSVYTPENNMGPTLSHTNTANTYQGLYINPIENGKWKSDWDHDHGFNFGGEMWRKRLYGHENDSPKDHEDVPGSPDLQGHDANGGCPRAANGRKFCEWNWVVGIQDQWRGAWGTCEKPRGKSTWSWGSCRSREGGVRGRGRTWWIEWRELREHDPTAWEMKKKNLRDPRRDRWWWGKWKDLEETKNGGNQGMDVWWRKSGSHQPNKR